MAEHLKTYRAKRDFSRTREPPATTVASQPDRFRFVVQKHDARRLHYDLRLELDGTFKSWAVTRGPSLDPSDKRLAVEVEDHPLDYGDFEGTIPEGEYGGGTVMVWDRGEWTPEQPDPSAALAAGELKFRLDGRKLKGSWVLVRMRHDRSGGKRTNWLLIKHRDEAARDGVATALPDDDTSVASGRSMEAIASGKGRKPRPFMTKSGARSGLDKSSPAPARDDSHAPDDPPAKPRRTARASAAKSGRPARKAAARSAQPEFIAPQLCRLVPRPPAGDGWIHEVKFDGYRIQLATTAGRATLRTRKGLDWTDRFSAIAAEAATLPDGIVDGEIVALDAHGLPDFAALQAALSSGDTDGLIYFAFDLLFAAGTDLREAPLSDRKTALETHLAAARSPLARIRRVEAFPAPGDAVLQAACHMTLEGIVSKRLDQPYRSGRTDVWTKSKCRGGQEVVIGGWTETAGRFRSLLAGAFRDGTFVYLGRVGTGFGRDKLARLEPALRAQSSAESPFAGPNAPRRATGLHFTRPSLVAEIESAGWTADGLLRQAAFKGLREDKPAAEVVPESADAPAAPPAGAAKDQPAGAAATSGAAAKGSRRGSKASPVVMGVAISLPDKVLWPAEGDATAVSKLDLARYYEAVGSLMLPHIAGRPCSLVRAPDGIGGQHFFQRHAGLGTSALLSQITLSGDRKPYLAVARVEGLIALAQSATMELHPTNGAPGAPDVPGRLVFDLDPAPDVSFRTVTEAALELRERLSAAGLVPLIKTTGGKGLHLVTPLVPRPEVDWATAKDFARTFCEAMAKDSPDRYLTTMAKKARTGRIFLDYLRNDRLSTAVAPWSPRARPGAPVSMPIAWSEVGPDLDPRRYTVPSLLGRIVVPPEWRDYDAAARPLPVAAGKAPRRRAR